MLWPWLQLRVLSLSSECFNLMLCPGKHGGSDHFRWWGGLMAKASGTCWLSHLQAVWGPKHSVLQFNWCMLILLLCKWIMLPIFIIYQFSIFNFLGCQGSCFIDGVELKSFKDLPLALEYENSPEHNSQRSLAEWNLDLIRLSPWITSLPIQCQCCLKIKNTIVIHSSASWIPAVTVIAQGRWEASASVKFQRNRAFTQHVSRMSLDKVSWDSEQLCTHFFVA